MRFTFKHLVYLPLLATSVFATPAYSSTQTGNIEEEVNPSKQIITDAEQKVLDSLSNLKVLAKQFSDDFCSLTNSIIASSTKGLIADTLALKTLNHSIGLEAASLKAALQKLEQNNESTHERLELMRSGYQAIINDLYTQVSQQGADCINYLDTAVHEKLEQIKAGKDQINQAAKFEMQLLIDMLENVSKITSTFIDSLNSYRS